MSRFCYPTFSEFLLLFITFNSDKVKEDAGKTSNYHCTEHPQPEEVGYEFRGASHLKRESKLPVLVLQNILRMIQVEYCGILAVQQTFSFLLVTLISFSIILIPSVLVTKLRTPNTGTSWLSLCPVQYPSYLYLKMPFVL